MTNKNRLIGHIKSNGDTQETLAAALGISLNSLNGKVNGKTEFTQGEIGIIADRYHFDGQEITAVFLCEESPLEVNTDG